MKFDAKAAEHEYVTTQTSYRKLAEKYEVSATVIQKLGKEKGWRKKREEYNAKVMQKLYSKSEEQELDKLAKCKTATDRAIAICMGMINDCEDGTPQDMRTCVAALKDLIGMQRDLHGLLSRKDELSLRQESGDNTETGVVYMPSLVPEADVYVEEGDGNA